MLLRSLMSFPAFHRLASLPSFLTAMPGSAAQLTGVFEARFCSARKHVSILAPQGPSSSGSLDILPFMA